MICIEYASTQPYIYIYTDFEYFYPTFISENMEWITYAFIKVEIPILVKFQDVKPYAYPTKFEIIFDKKSILISCIIPF